MVHTEMLSICKEMAADIDTGGLKIAAHLTDTTAHHQKDMFLSLVHQRIAMYFKVLY